MQTAKLFSAQCYNESCFVSFLLTLSLVLYIFTWNSEFSSTYLEIDGVKRYEHEVDFWEYSNDYYRADL